MSTSRGQQGIIVTIDGPAGSGKSSTAKEVASRLGFSHLDSGAFYRAVTLAALDRGIPVESWQHLSAGDLDQMGIDALPAAGGYSVRINGVDPGMRLRSPEVNANVSRMAAVPAVRRWLLGALRAAGRMGNLVADGRDAGTVIFPEAELKVFLVCEPRVRAKRRLLERGVEPVSETELGHETERLILRDHLDASRDEAPLAQAPDAVLLDTTPLTFEDQVKAIVELARARAERVTR